MSKVKWNSNNITDQSGKIVIITGASGGLGYEAAKALSAKKATVIMAVRNVEKGKAAAEIIKSIYKYAKIEVIELDLADLSSVEKFARTIKEKYDRLDILINNAGVMMPPYSKTQNGFELQIGTNHLGHFALTSHLLPLLKATKEARIVNVSSNAHKFGNLNLQDINWEKRKYTSWKSYGDSKIANLYFTYELQRRFENAKLNIITAAAHPGWTATELQRHSGLFEAMNGLFAQTSEMGTLPILYAATAPDVKSGDYYGPSGWQEWRGYPKKTVSNELSHNKKIAHDLWELSEEMTKTDFKL